MEWWEEQLGVVGVGVVLVLDFIVENVEKVLYQFYYDFNIENKNLVQKWLMQVQVFLQVWYFSWQLL